MLHSVTSAILSAMTQMIDRVTAWLGKNTADSRLVADEVLTGNLKRIRWVTPVVMILNLVCAGMYHYGSGQSAQQQLAYKSAICRVHMGMALCMLACALAAHWLSRQPKAGRKGLWLQVVVPLSAMLFAVAFSVIEQAVTPNISPYLLSCAYISLLLLMRPAMTVWVFVIGYVFFFVGIGFTQPDQMQLLSNRTGGFFAAVLGLILGLVLWQRNTEYVLLQRKLKRRNRVLLEQQHDLVWLAKRDALTGLFNRGEFLRLAEAELLRAHRHRHDTSAIMVDIDFFKNINDAYGHPAGDSALRHTAACLLAGVRATDVVARVGGEEFMVLLPQTSGDAALALAHKLQLGLQLAPAQISDDLEIALTASFGVGTLPAGKSGTVAWLYASCDHALYEAKRRGRNRVEKTEMDASLTSTDFQRMKLR